MLVILRSIYREDYRARINAHTRSVKKYRRNILISSQFGIDNF